MIKYFLNIVIIAVASVLLFSCKEKEVELEASPDMLIFVRTNEILVEVKDVPNKSEIVQAVEKELQQKTYFVRGNVYEMKLGTSRVLDLYDSLDAFNNGKVQSTGKYTFAADAMYVTFELDGKSNTFFIDGHFGNTFYNHFVRNEGTGSHHTVEASKILCLHDDFTKELQQKYPELVLANIKTDMMTIRRLETFK